MDEETVEEASPEVLEEVEPTMDYDKLDANKRLALVNARILNEESNYFQSTLNSEIAAACNDDAAKAGSDAAADRSSKALDVLRAEKMTLVAAGAVEGAEQAGPGPGGPRGRQG